MSYYYEGNDIKHRTSVLGFFSFLFSRTIPDFTLLSETLKLSKNVLLRDPCQMASQFIGRLHQIVEADKPVAPGIVCDS